MSKASFEAIRLILDANREGIFEKYKDKYSPLHCWPVSTARRRNFETIVV